jgi:hypothetical protein
MMSKQIIHFLHFLS